MLKSLSKLIMSLEIVDVVCFMDWMLVEKFFIYGMCLSGWCIFVSSDFIFGYMNYEWIGVFVCDFSVRMFVDYIYEFVWSSLVN